MKIAARAGVARLAYPLFIVWPVSVALLALHFGLLTNDPHQALARTLGEVVVFLVSATPVVAAVAWLEKHLPAQTAVRPTRQDVQTDLAHIAAAWFALTPFAQQLLKLLAFVSAGWLTSLFGRSVWPTHWPVGVQMLLAIVIGEFGQYWFHRLAHEEGYLWRLHATHHGAHHLYWLNSTRFHALEVVVKNLFQVGPLIVLGCSRDAFFAYGIFTAVHGWVQHSNVAYRSALFNYFLATPSNHRWHHSTDLAEANHNFGVVITLWDHVFGTFYAPRTREFNGPFGISYMPEFPTAFLAQQTSPFIWNRLPRTDHGTPPVRSDGTTEPASAAH